MNKEVQIPPSGNQFIPIYIYIYALLSVFEEPPWNRYINSQSHQQWTGRGPFFPIPLPVNNCYNVRFWCQPLQQVSNPTSLCVWFRSGNFSYTCCHPCLLVGEKHLFRSFAILWSNWLCFASEVSEFLMSWVLTSYQIQHLKRFLPLSKLPFPTFLSHWWFLWFWKNIWIGCGPLSLCHLLPVTLVSDTFGVFCLSCFVF